MKRAFVRPRLKNEALHWLHKLGLRRFDQREVSLTGGGRALLRSGTHDEHIVAEIFEAGGYPLERIEFAPDDVLIDGGAQIGLFTLFAARTPARLIALEPAAHNQALLRRNLELNGLAERVDLHALALARTGLEKVDLWLSYTNTGGSSIMGPVGPRRRVPAISIEGLFEKFELERVRLLKLDIEGAEYPVLYSTPPEILVRIDHLFVEAEDISLLPPPDDPRWPAYKPDALIDFLRACGFEVEAVVRTHRSAILHAVSPAARRAGQNS